MKASAKMRGPPRPSPMIQTATPIRKAVFPVAGLGTRFWPATKVTSKEMLPVVDRPLIQYALEEATAAGITQIIFVTGHNSQALAHYLDPAHNPQGQGAAAALAPKGVSCVFVHQERPLGLGHAVQCAESAVADEPFAVILPDDLIDSQPPCLAQLAEIWAATGASVIAVEEVSQERISRYGVIAGTRNELRHWKVEEIVEKPEPAAAPSNLGVVGRYILTPRIFACLRDTLPARNGEIQLTDALALQLSQEPVTAYQFEGRRYDCGSKFGLLQANIDYALKDETMRPELERFLAEKV